MMHAGRRETLYTRAPSVQATSAGEPLFARAHREDCELRARRLRRRLHSPTLSVSRSRGHSKRPLFRFSLPARSSCLPVRAFPPPPRSPGRRPSRLEHTRPLGRCECRGPCRADQPAPLRHIHTDTHHSLRSTLHFGKTPTCPWLGTAVRFCLPTAPSMFTFRRVLSACPILLPHCKPIGSRTNIP